GHALFFFSSRRRHTILVSDWSSDVCSSDLDDDRQRQEGPQDPRGRRGRSGVRRLPRGGGAAGPPPDHAAPLLPGLQEAGGQGGRSEERRVGKEGRWGGWRERCKRGRS